MADGEPSAGTASAATPKKATDDVTVGGPKVDVSTRLSVSEQGAERDWQFLMLIVFGLALLLTGSWILNIMVTALCMVLVFPIKVLRYLMTDDTGFPVISLLLVAAVYGGYSIMPILLRPPVEKTSIHSGDGAITKYPKAIARLKSMGYTYVTTIEGFQETRPVIGADGKSYCPVIVAVVKPVTSDDPTTLPLERPVTSPLMSEGPRVNDNKITVEAGNDWSHSDVAPGGIQGDLPPQDKPVAGPLDTSHVLGESIVAADIHTNAIVKEEAVAAEGGSDMSSEDTLGLDELFAQASPASKGSAETPLSSDESELCEDQKTEDDASEHVTRDFVQPYQLKQITREELDRMAKAHGNLSFCIGPLWVAEAMQAPDVRSYYLDYENKKVFPASCLGSHRPISADGKDIDYLLGCLGDQVPASIQRLLPDNVDILHQTRNGATGSNMVMAELTEQFFRDHHKLPNLEAVRLLEKERTLRQRYNLIPGVEETAEYRQFFDLLPGVVKTSEQLDMLPGMEESSEYRRFLTNDEEVRLGNTDYLESVHAGDDECEEQVLETLKGHPDYDGAKLPNLVLPWLNGIEEFGLYDPNAHLPCECGKAALAIHMESRENAEPGVYLCAHDYEAPELTFLSESALREDQQRKKLEEQYSSAPVGCIRSQQIFQICELHTLTTNKPYILTDGFEDLNDALVTTGGDLPVPGFWKYTKYPAGFTVPFGFFDFEHNYRPPRCRHGNLHPPFVGHCVSCFPTGEHDGDCSECDGHAHADALKLVGTKEKDMDAAGKQWDQHQLKKVSAAARWEKEVARRVDYSWPLPQYRPWLGW